MHGAKECTAPVLSPDETALYVGLDTGALVALAAKTGRELWRYCTPGTIILNIPRVIPGLEYVLVQSSGEPPRKRLDFGAIDAYLWYAASSCSVCIISSYPMLASGR
jgi:hypothetical protein